MKREIKFRAWDKELKIMSYFDLYNYMSMAEHYQDKVVTFEARQTGLMQFTGLKDKNGKEIYEGDIIRIQEPTEISGQVFMRLGCWFVENICEIGYIKGHFEVIGNIHENPELLEKKP